MAIFFGGEKVEAVLFSPLQGKLTFEGKPASDAKINLWIKWKDSEGETFSYTADEDGMFSIPEHTATYKQSAIAQIVITQEITVEFKNKNYLIWTLSKSKTDRFGELGGSPTGLTCNITDELEPVAENQILMATNCHWDSISRS